MTTPRRILGLDPGLQTTGYGVLEISADGPRIAEAGVIRSVEGRAKVELEARLKTLYDGVVEVLDQWQPTALAIEELYAHYDHPRTAILMAHARGCFMLAGVQRGIPVLSYSATQIKKRITGYGRASKEQMQHCILRELQLAELPEPHDVSDALAVALCHHYASGHFVQGTKSTTFQSVNLLALYAGDDSDSED